MDMAYKSTKIIDGFSTCFRQWRATHSHCRFLHGYALQFKLVFSCNTLDDKNWCFDFGGTKEFKKWFDKMFDHTTVVASDDPQLATFMAMDKNGLIQVREVEAVGCEKFAQLVYEYVSARLDKGRVLLESVECIENNKNSAIYNGR